MDNLSLFYRWIDTIEQAQYTDVHNSTSTGDASFNWRMVFNFQYHPAEKKVSLTSFLLVKNFIIVLSIEINKERCQTVI